MHETMARLYQAVKELKGIEGRGVQSEIARLLDASPQQIKNWEGRGISNQGMIDISKMLGLSVHWLKTGQGRMQVNTLQAEVEHLAGSVKSKAQGLSNITATGFHLSRVPVISWAQAGNWRDIEHYGSDDMGYVQTVKPIEGGFALRIHNDSMQPEFTDGDIIVIDPHAPQDAGSYVVAIHDNQAALRKLVLDGTTPYLKPLNPQYPMLSWDEGTRIVGVVKQKVKTY